MRMIPHLCGSGGLYIPRGCRLPYFTGLDNETVVQGTDFDLRAGVSGFDAEGNPVPYDISPDEFDQCTVGNQVYAYIIGDYSKDRIITVTQAEDPTISGVADITVESGTDFDPLTGVSAADWQGDPVEVTYNVVPPNLLGGPLLGGPLLGGFLGAQNDDTDVPPVIHGPSEPIEVHAGEEFDPFDGMHATDSRGYTIAMSVELREAADDNQ